MVFFTLISKKLIAHDVFWLNFKTLGNVKMPIEGQFLTFLLPKSGGRAYSILQSDKEHFEFIIKRLENGRWWSKEICDLPLGSEIKWVGPAGHFILKETSKNKLFFATGTWFVPLYYQILGSTQKNLSCQLKLIFWVREQKDIFYEHELKKIEKHNPNFSYDLYLSQEKHEDYSYGRITQYIDEVTIKDFEEFYICWNPSMVDEVEKKLLELWVLKESIFMERY